MVRKSWFISFVCLLLLSFSSHLLAAPATVTNNGNTRVRVQYKTPEGQYQDLHLNPGETQTLPGGVEKVKLVREIGEWAAPLPAGVILEVEVRVGDQTVGKSTWYGEKVFFDSLTEAPPVTAPVPEVKEIPAVPAPSSESTEPKPTPQPVHETPHSWFPSIFDWQFNFLIFLVMLPFVLMLGRSFLRPGWTAGDGLYSGLRAQYLLTGFILGGILGFWGVWGNLVYGDDFGFLPFLAQDLYSFPFFLLTLAGKLTGFSAGGISGIFPAPLIVVLFWILLCGGLGATVGVVRAPLLNSFGMVMALLPLLVFMRGGCLGQNAYAWQDAYSAKVSLYPGAFASLIIIPFLFVFLFNLVKPYHGYVNGGYSSTVGQPFLGGGGCLIPFLACLAGLLFGGFGLWGHSAFAEHSLLGPLFGPIVSLPLLIGFPFLDHRLVIVLFWGIFIGGLGCGYGRNRWHNGLLGCSAATLIALLILVSSLMLGRDAFHAIDSEIYEQYMDMVDDIPAMPGDFPDAVLEAYGDLRRAGFGDDLEDDRPRRLGRSLLGGEIGFQGADGFQQDAYQRDNY